MQWNTLKGDDERKQQEEMKSKHFGKFVCTVDYEIELNNAIYSPRVV